MKKNYYHFTDLSFYDFLISYLKITINNLVLGNQERSQKNCNLLSTKTVYESSMFDFAETSKREKFERMDIIPKNVTARSFNDRCIHSSTDSSINVSLKKYSPFEKYYLK